MCIYTWLWRGFKTFQRTIPAKTWPAQHRQALQVSQSPSICHFFKGWKTLKGSGAVWFTWAVGPNPHISMIRSVRNTSLALNGRITVYIQLQLAHFSVLLCPADSSLSTFLVIYYSAKGVWQTRHQLRILLSVFSAGKTSAGDHWGCLPIQKGSSVGPHHAGCVQ